MGGSYVQIRVNQDMKVEKDLSSDSASAETMVLADLAVGLDDIFNLLNGRLVNGSFN